MAAVEKEQLKEVRNLIKCVTGFEEYEENYTICEKFAASNLKYHRFLDVNSDQVGRQLLGLIDKFKIHSETLKATKLKELSQIFLETPGFEGRETGKTDTHYAILSFLLLISDNPVNSDYVERKIVKETEVKDDFDWGAYLMEGIERYDPSDGELSDWSEDEEDIQRRCEEAAGHADDTINTQSSSVAGDQQLQGLDHAVSPGDDFVEGEVSEELSDSDWLRGNLIAQYWQGEELEIESGRYKSCQLNNDWEAYKQAMDPLQGNRNQTVVTENILLREVIWMLMGVSKLHLLHFNGRFFTPKHDIAVPTLSQELLQDFLCQFTRCGSYIQILKNFVESSFRKGSGEMCQTYQSFGTSVADFLQNVNTQLCDIEHRLIKQEETMTMISISREVKPLMQKVAIICMVYMRGVHQGRSYKLTSQKATLLLTMLYDALVSVDTLMEQNVFTDEEDMRLCAAYDQVEITRLLLSMWLQTSRPYINIIDTWISHGYLEDPCKEFIIHRNATVKTLDETFWDKSFAFHTMMQDPDASVTDESHVDKSRLKPEAKTPGAKMPETQTPIYDTKDWAPTFLQPVLQEVLLTGKSMEMLEGLGKLAEQHGTSNNMQKLKEFKETHLYTKFISTLQTLLGMKAQKTTEEHPGETTHEAGEGIDNTTSAFSPEIERQLEERGIKDDFLKIHFGKLMSPQREKHSFLDVNFSNAMQGIDTCTLLPQEVIIQHCLYPHIHTQYERVCLRLVDTMKTEYKLMQYLQVMRSVFLMEAGDALYVFYSDIFDKIRLHEHWKDATTLTWALHEALEEHYPDDVQRISITVETNEGDDKTPSRDAQPINITNCLQVNYEISSPVDVVINERCQQLYNHIFKFLLQIKHAKYCLDELRFYDLGKECAPSTSVDRLLKTHNLDNTPRQLKIHRMHILRMELINFVNSVHNYIMTRILHSVGLEFTKNISKAKDLDQIIEVHAGYIRKIHERCLLHKRTAFLGEAILRVLNLALCFQKQWDTGIDNISMKQIEESENDFSRCIHFLRSFLTSVIQRGSFPDLETLAFGLENLKPR